MPLICRGTPSRCQQPSSPCLVAHRFCSSAASKTTRAMSKRFGQGFAAHPAPTRGGSRLQHTLRHLSPPRLASPSWAHRSQAAALHPQAHPSLPAFPRAHSTPRTAAEKARTHPRHLRPGISTGKLHLSQTTTYFFLPQEHLLPLALDQAGGKHSSFPCCAQPAASPQPSFKVSAITSSLPSLQIGNRSRFTTHRSLPRLAICTAISLKQNLKQKH